MRNSFRPTSYKNVEQGLLFFNPMPYSRVHDEGGDTTWEVKPQRKAPFTVNVEVPERKFMWLSDIAIQRIEEFTLGFILDGTSGGRPK